MSKFNNKISNLINSQVPEFVLEDHPKFIEFLKAYYAFMESAELNVTSVETTDGLQLESETNQTNELLLDATKIATDRTSLDVNSKVLLESSFYGKFTRGEIVTGQTSKAIATVLTEDLINDRLFISAQDKFIIGETIVGSSSNASAIVNNYKPNPVENIQDLLNFRDADKVIDNFLTHFKFEFLNTLPDILASGLNKRNLIKNIKYLYGLKGTREGNNLFFRLLFNESAETIYPRDQILRVSDGKWTTNTIIRVIATIGDTANLIGRTITGESSGATAIVENVSKFQIEEDEISEIILNVNSITGNFLTGEQIIGTKTNTDDYYIKANITGLLNVPVITNGGSLYNVNDNIVINGGGQGALIKIDAVGHGGISSFFIDNPGTGYKIGDDLFFNNANTNGGAAVAKVQIVNGGLLIEDSLGDIVLEDATTKGDPYTGNILVQESATGAGDITKIRLINSGTNYTSLPTVTVTSSTGTNATIKAYGNTIGRVQSIKIIESGKGYENSPSPTLTLPLNILFTQRSGNFAVGENITGLASDNLTIVTAKIINFNYNTNIINLSNATGIFGVGNTITGSLTNATAKVEILDQATATTNVTSLLNTSGSYINQDGWLDENSMLIEDDLIYQDFSYIIKVGRAIRDWRDSFKKTMHPAGFYISSQVSINSQINARLRNVTGVNSGTEYNPIQEVINSGIFGTVFGRRLGTTVDGTSLNATPNVGVVPFAKAGTHKFFTSNTRDTTLRSSITFNFQKTPYLNVRGTNSFYGYANAGPRMRNINRFAFTMFSGSGHPQNSLVGNDHNTSTYINPMLISNFEDFSIIGTKKNGTDGTTVEMGDISNVNLKTYVALPTEITVSQP